MAFKNAWSDYENEGENVATVEEIAKRQTKFVTDNQVLCCLCMFMSLDIKFI